MTQPTDHPAPATRPARRTMLAGLAATLLPVPAFADDATFRTLRAAPLRAKVAPDAGGEADLWAFDGEAAPPVLRVRHGEEVRVRLRNDTPSDLALHWHGVRNANAQDGVAGLTQPPVRPGDTFDYRFTPPDPGTALIRPMVPGRAGEAAGRGLAGILVVAEREPPLVDAEYVLLVRDWLTDPSGALAPFGEAREAALAGRLGNRIAVAGMPAPNTVALPPGSRVRIRIANGCNARITRIRFDGVRTFVAAVDGQPTETFEPLRASLPFPPGARYDIILDLPREPGAAGAITALVGSGVPLVAFTSTAEAAKPAGRPAIAAPPPNPALPPEIRLQNAVRRDIVIAGGAARGPDGQPVMPAAGAAIWTMNGAAGRAGAAPLFTAKRGQPVVIGFENRTNFPQPIHVHGHVVRQLHPLDDGWEPYWLDTVQVPEGKTVRVALLADNPGRWMIASTVLERLDTGLWSFFEVA